MDLSISLNKTLTVENGSFFARGLGAKDSNKGFFWGESSSVVSPAVGLVYNGIGFVGENKLQLKEMIDGDTSTLVTFKLDGKVGIGTTEPGGVPGLEMAKLQVDSGHVVISNGFGFLTVNASNDGLGAGIDTESDDRLSLYAGGTKRMTIDSSGRIGIGTTEPGLIPGLTSARLQVDNGHVVVSNNFGFLSANTTNNGIGAGLDTEPDDALSLYAGGQTRMTIVDTGNVGIGTTSPDAKLEVIGNTSINNTAGNTELLVNTPGTSTTSLKLFEAGAFGFQFEYDGATNVDKLYLRSRGFCCGNEAIRMTWLKNGNVGIGTVSPTQALDVNGNIRSSGGFLFAQDGDQSVSIKNNASGGYVQLDVGGSGHTTDHIILGEDQGGNLNKVGIGTTSPTELLQVGVNGTGEALSNAWNVFSDRRYKTDIQNLENALENISKLNGYTYYSRNGQDQSRKIGVVAQEVEEVFPELVNTSEEGFKSVDYGRLSAILIEALKEQNVKINKLENENSIIRKEFAVLKDMIAK